MPFLLFFLGATVIRSCIIVPFRCSHTQTKKWLTSSESCLWVTPSERRRRRRLRRWHPRFPPIYHRLHSDNSPSSSPNPTSASSPTRSSSPHAVAPPGSLSHPPSRHSPLQIRTLRATAPLLLLQPPSVLWPQPPRARWRRPWGWSRCHPYRLDLPRALARALVRALARVVSRSAPLLSVSWCGSKCEYRSPSIRAFVERSLGSLLVRLAQFRFCIELIHTLTWSIVRSIVNLEVDLVESNLSYHDLVVLIPIKGFSPPCS